MSVDGKFHHYEVTGCGDEGPEGYKCTRHEGGLHVARGLTLDSWADEWPITPERAMELAEECFRRVHALNSENPPVLADMLKAMHRGWGSSFTGSGR